MSISTYLKKLKFKPEWLDSLAGRYLQNIRLMVIIVLAILISGTFSLVTLPRTLNPEVDIAIVTVSTVFPGASPQDVESLVTIPLEEKIKSAKDLSDYSSSSQANVSVVVTEFESGVDLTEARGRVQSAVDSVSLPEGAQTPRVRELDFENLPVVETVVYAKNETKDLASLMRLGRDLKAELEELQQVDMVQVGGLDEQKIKVIISPNQIVEKGLRIDQVSQAVSQALSEYPAGRVVTDQLSFDLALKQPAKSLDEMRQIPIFVSGQSYRLADLARVEYRSGLEWSPAYFKNPKKEVQPALVLSVFKNPSSQLDATGEVVDKRIAEFMSGFEKRFAYQLTTDYPQLIDDQFSDLGKNLMQTLVLVFLSMFLVYGIRQAGIAASAIPLSLLVVFLGMKFFSLSLNFVSIYSLLIALGLFVDNAVVVIEAYTSYYKTKKFSVLQTGVLVWRDYFVELFSINLLTVWAFLPLLVSKGIIGEFIYAIPIVVSTAMMGSVAVAMLFTLPAMMLLSGSKMAKRVKWLILGLGVLGLEGLATYLLPKNALLVPTLFALNLLAVLGWYLKDWIKARFSKKIKLEKVYKTLNQGFVDLSGITRKYHLLICKIIGSSGLRKRALGLVVGLSLLSYLLLPLGLIENEFFPASDQERVYVQLNLASGTKRDITAIEVRELLDRLSRYSQIEFLTGQVGRVADTGFGVSSSGTHNGLITLKLVDESKRKTSSIQLAQTIRQDLGDYTKGEIQVVEESSGPPVGADLQVTFLGPELSELQKLAEKTEEFMKDSLPVTNVERSIKPGTSRMVFEPSQGKLSQYQLNQAQIGFWLRSLASGMPVDEVEFDNQDYEVELKLSDSFQKPEDLSGLNILTPRGAVPLLGLGELKLESNPTLISRQNGERSLTVSAKVLPGESAPEINPELIAFLEDELEISDNYRWDQGGVNQENQESVESIVQAMAISLVLIVATMVIQLGSFRQAFIVISVIPLAVSGVFVLFAVTGTPLSFPALIGLLSLFGIVIANSLMIVDKINQNLKVGIGFSESICDAASSRLEPILLTSGSQVIGLIPITLSDPLWRGMGGAIISGLSFSGVIMLIFVPIVYYYLFPEKRTA